MAEVEATKSASRCCGGLVAANAPISQKFELFELTAKPGQFTTRTVHSAYLGPVDLRCVDLGRDYVALLYPIKSLDGNRNIYVKAIDAGAYNLSVDVNYPLNYLFNTLQATVINVNECKRHFDIIQRLSAKPNKTKQEQQRLHKSLIHNCPVDVLFNTCLYIEFLQQKLGIDNMLANNNTAIALHNLNKLDNAFFTGSYMVYGNGDSLFHPLTTLDICGHESGPVFCDLLCHAIVQLLAGLIYQGHAGALNESFADALGCAFEFYVYERFPHLRGKSDWLIGEDSGKGMLILRDLSDPNAVAQPQPKYYRAAYWADPNSTIDYGGVHSNSGVGNYSFYLFCTKTTVASGLLVFVNALRTLKTTANYLDLRDALKKSAGTQITVMQEVLNLVGLTDTMINDWTKQPTALLHTYDSLVKEIIPKIPMEEEPSTQLVAESADEEEEKPIVKRRKTVRKK